MREGRGKVRCPDLAGNRRRTGRTYSVISNEASKTIKVCLKEKAQGEGKAGVGTGKGCKTRRSTRFSEGKGGSYRVEARPWKGGSLVQAPRNTYG